jgi:hypothetical protein
MPFPFLKYFEIWWSRIVKQNYDRSLNDKAPSLINPELEMREANVFTKSIS